jgi:hypothetical protein
MSLKTKAPIALGPQIVRQSLPTEMLPRLRSGAQYFEGRFELIVRRINFLDALYLGYRPADPFDSVTWGEFEAERQQLELKANQLWCKLRVINSGFDLIRSAAVAQDVNFPFDDPRSLFVEIVKEQFHFDAAPLLADGICAGATLSETRKAVALQSKLFRGRAEPHEEKAFLDSCQNNGWSGFWMAAIWRHRFKKHLREDWNRFCQAHKASAALLNDKKITGTITWTQGRPTTQSRKAQQPKLSGIIYY